MKKKKHNTQYINNIFFLILCLYSKYFKAFFFFTTLSIFVRPTRGPQNLHFECAAEKHVEVATICITVQKI